MVKQSNTSKIICSGSTHRFDRTNDIRIERHEEYFSKQTNDNGKDQRNPNTPPQVIHSYGRRVAYTIVYISRIFYYTISTACGHNKILQLFYNNRPLWYNYIYKDL